MSRRVYVFSLLQELCTGIELLEDYKDQYLTRDSRIKGKCIMCENTFDKSFDRLYKLNNFGCKDCAKIIGKEKAKKTNTISYGFEYASKSDIVKNKIKNTNIEKYGFECALKNENVKNKMKITLSLRTEEEKQIIEQKRIETNIEKYGVKYVAQINEVQEKIKQTNSEKSQEEKGIIKEKVKETNMKRYGKEYFTQTDIMKEKSIKTNMERYNVKYTLQRPDIKEKIKETNKEKYGVEYHSQNPEIFEQMTKKSYLFKEYTLPSGNIIKIQGYEPFALNELLLKYDENDIITGSKNVPNIWYDYEDKNRVHFVDIFIKSDNKCIEVKSTWTFKVQKEKVLKKKEAGEKLGFIYEIWIYNKEGKKLEVIL